MKRSLRGADYDITVKNPQGRQSGVTRMLLDGTPVEGNVIVTMPGHHTVEVFL